MLSTGRQLGVCFLPCQKEIDLRLQQDKLTAIGLSGRIDQGDNHVGISELLRDRVLQSVYGPIALDSSREEFVDVGRYGVAIPGYAEATSLTRSRLFDASMSRPSITSESLWAREKFVAPSNIMFVPGEFWSLNCNTCPPDDPLSIDPTRADNPISLAEISNVLERCPFVYDSGGSGNPGGGTTGGGSSGEISISYDAGVFTPQRQKIDQLLSDYDVLDKVAGEFFANNHNVRIISDPTISYLEVHSDEPGVIRINFDNFDDDESDGWKASGLAHEFVHVALFSEG